MTQGTTSYIEMLGKFGDNLGLLAEAGRRQADRSPEEKHREVQVDFLVVRRQDCAAKIVKGGMKPALRMI